MHHRMGILVQIRDVPEDIHHEMKARAALAGMSLSEFARGLFARSMSRPTPSQLSTRIAARGPVALDQPSERVVRSIRDHGE
jgi:antitoxin FitA